MQTLGSYSEGIEKVLTDSVLSWYNEKKDSNQGDINKCCGGLKFSRVGHFLQVVQDKVASIGCAAVTYTKNRSKHVLVTCNYSYPNVDGSPTYVSGKVGSQCPSGRDYIFTNLCKS